MNPFLRSFVVFVNAYANVHLSKPYYLLYVSVSTIFFVRSHACFRKRLHPNTCRVGQSPVNTVYILNFWLIRELKYTAYVYGPGQL